MDSDDETTPQFSDEDIEEGGVQSRATRRTAAGAATGAAGAGAGSAAGAAGSAASPVRRDWERVTSDEDDEAHFADTAEEETTHMHIAGTGPGSSSAGASKGRTVDVQRMGASHGLAFDKQRLYVTAPPTTAPKVEEKKKRGRPPGSGRGRGRGKTEEKKEEKKRRGRPPGSGRGRGRGRPRKEEKEDIPELEETAEEKAATSNLFELPVRVNLEGFVTKPTQIYQDRRTGKLWGFTRVEPLSRKKMVRLLTEPQLQVVLLQTPPEAFVKPVTARPLLIDDEKRALLMARATQLAIQQLIPRLASEVDRAKARELETEAQDVFLGVENRTITPSAALTALSGIKDIMDRFTKPKVSYDELHALRTQLNIATHAGDVSEISRIRDQLEKLDPERKIRIAKRAHKATRVQRSLIDLQEQLENATDPKEIQHLRESIEMLKKPKKSRETKFEKELWSKTLDREERARSRVRDVLRREGLGSAREKLAQLQLKPGEANEPLVGEQFQVEPPALLEREGTKKKKPSEEGKKKEPKKK